MKNILKVFCLLIFFVHFSYPQVDLNKTAQSTMNFLLVGTSPKASAMGEAYTAAGSGSESIFYNPAGIARSSGTFDININYARWIADINYLSGGATWNMNNMGVIGIHLLTVDYGTINGTSLIYESEKDLYPLGYKDNGTVSNVGAYSVGLTYAKSISQEFSIGVTAKIAGQNLGQNLMENGMKDNNAAKLVFDAGIHYLTSYNDFRFGMSIRNFSSNLKREEIDEQLPLVFSLGAAIDLMKVIDAELAQDNPVTLAVDFLHQNNYSERVNLGIEYKMLNMISLRGGYQTNRDLASWSGGVGFNTSINDYDIEVNYSYSQMEIFDDVSRISIIFTF